VGEDGIKTIRGVGGGFAAVFEIYLYQSDGFTLLSSSAIAYPPIHKMMAGFHSGSEINPVEITRYHDYLSPIVFWESMSNHCFPPIEMICEKKTSPAPRHLQQ
jgi:hypothetical protein